MNVDGPPPGGCGYAGDGAVCGADPAFILEWSDPAMDAGLACEEHADLAAERYGASIARMTPWTVDPSGISFR